MLNDQRPLTLATTTSQELSYGGDDSPTIRDIHALTPPNPPRQEAWEASNRQSSSLSVASTATEGSEDFTTMSREFNALVLAGATIGGHEHESGSSNLGRIREEGNFHEESNPLAVVADNNPMGSESPRGGGGRVGLSSVSGSSSRSGGELSVQSVKKEEVESKISAWQNAKIAKINNRFKREDVVINGWEGEQVQKASSCMKKIERKLEEKRAKAQEKMQNEIAKAHRKAEERRASADAKRGTKVARIIEIANLMRAAGRPPVKRSFF